MSVSRAVANAAAAAAAAGAGKKAAQVQLQAELASDEEWNKFLQRDGLLVVDVYTEWCGPCIGMVGNLKKIKVEIGGDNLHLAVAKADTIECLKRFRNRSEPTWMFIASGQLLNVVFGADAPRLARTIEEELRNEEAVKKGERERPTRAPFELTPHEQEAALALERLQQQRREREAAAIAETRTARREARARRLDAFYNDACPALVLPHAQKNLRKITDALEPYGVVVADKCPLVVGKEGSKILIMEDPELGAPEAVAALIERPSLAMLLKKLPDREGKIIELIRQAIFGDGLETEEGEPPKKFVSDELKAGNVPGIFVPADRHQRASALDLLFPKMVSTVVEPPTAADPPAIAVVLAAWQRRAALASVPAPRLLRYGFFAYADLKAPKLVCKTIDQYEQRAEKDYSETIVLMIAVGVAEPLLADPGDVPPPEPPEQLLALGPLHVSEDAVEGAEECALFFPPGYSDPDPKPKPKSRKKKKKRTETKDETIDESVGESSIAANEDGEVYDGSAEGDGNLEEGEEEFEREGEGEVGEANHVDKATSPPPGQA